MPPSSNNTTTAEKKVTRVASQKKGRWKNCKYTTMYLMPQNREKNYQRMSGTNSIDRWSLESARQNRRRANKNVGRKSLMGSNGQRNARVHWPRYKQNQSSKDQTGWRTDIADVFDAPFTWEEVRFQMEWLPPNLQLGQTALLNIRGRLCKALEVSCKLSYTKCQKREQVLDSWKVSTTVLAYNNKGDWLDSAKWRPICFQNTVYKIFAVTYSLKSKKEVYVAWLTLKMHLGHC